jgi:hypothetical protein
MDGRQERQGQVEGILGLADYGERDWDVLGRGEIATE